MFSLNVCKMLVYKSMGISYSIRYEVNCHHLERPKLYVCIYSTHKQFMEIHASHVLTCRFGWMLEHRCFFPTLLALVLSLHWGVTTSTKQTATGKPPLLHTVTPQLIRGSDWSKPRCQDCGFKHLHLKHRFPKICAREKKKERF